jgi:ribonucleoside-diphosphate reductase beta chain
MQAKLDLMLDSCGDLSKKLNFAKQLSVLLLGEGIALFGAFACLINLTRFGILRNFNVINQWSLKDEADHVAGNISVLSEVRKELSDDENKELDAFIIETVAAYVDAENVFLDLVFGKYNQEDFTLDEAKGYIRYLGQLRLYQLGMIGAREVPESELPWLDDILYGSSHTNFFESRVTDYSHNTLEGGVDYGRYATLLEGRV